MDQNNHWADEAIFYHIYPLGFCGAPAPNDFSSEPVNRLEKVRHWLPHIQSLGVNALYLGPLFESSAHGYDTADYYKVDRRLGDNSSLTRLSSELHQKGMRLILDGVFNHVGRDFWAFRDVQKNGVNSAYHDWFAGLRFDTQSQYGDPFTYEPWNGHYDLVKLNLKNKDTRTHIFEAIRTWVEQFDIDGLRLDVADCLDFDFLKALRTFCRSLRPDFWLMGEVIHGDYRKWVNDQTLDSVTNYECYKGLYSSLVDKNCFEIAWSLNRQFGPEGMYAGMPLYNFADNHDVDRVASSLKNPAHLVPLYLLLFSMPGVPSIYYGSEWGVKGTRTIDDDSALRPDLNLEAIEKNAPQPNLAGIISRLAGIRKSLPALRYGDYRQLQVAHEQLAFSRTFERESVIVLLNASGSPARLEIPIDKNVSGAVDVLNQDERFQVQNGRLIVEQVHACWGRILKLE
jgi:cyclomaltodextrinase